MKPSFFATVLSSLDGGDKPWALDLKKSSVAEKVVHLIEYSSFLFLAAVVMDWWQRQSVRIRAFCSSSSKTRNTQMATRVTDGARWERRPRFVRSSSSKTRDTQMATGVTDGVRRERRPRFARLAASPLARACNPLTEGLNGVNR